MISWKVIDELIIFVSIKVTVDTRYTLRKRCAEFESTLEFVTVLIRTCKMEKRVPNCPTDSYVIFSRYEVSHDHVPGILVETAAYRKSRSKLARNGMYSSINFQEVHVHVCIFEHRVTSAPSLQLTSVSQKFATVWEKILASYATQLSLIPNCPILLLLRILLLLTRLL